MDTRLRPIHRIARASIRSQLFRASIIYAICFVALLAFTVRSWCSSIGLLALAGGYAVQILVVGFTFSDLTHFSREPRLVSDKPEQSSEAASHREKITTRIALAIGFWPKVVVMILTPPRVLDFSMAVGFVLYCMIPFVFYGAAHFLMTVGSRVSSSLRAS